MDLHNKKHLGFLGAILIILISLGSFIYYQESLLRTGETTILKTRPVDPRDLLRGEYVVLRYVLGDDEQVVSLARTIRDGEIHIGLTEDDNGVASVTMVSSEKTSFTDDLLWITGTVENGRVNFPTIEQYFVSEGAGKGIERMGSDVNVEVVLKGGHARILQLLDANLQPVDPDAFLD